ncbi:MAG TPA: EamA family transporter [Chitinophagaceae bacterium]|nr:EamA family transporter [Chitinophagaceae bacterium]
MKALTKAYVALGVVSFVWGTTYVASRVGAQQMPGFFMAGVRQFLSGVILVIFFLLRGYRIPEWKVLRNISVQGIFLLCIANGGLTWAMEYISGGLAAIIVALVPIFIALFTVWVSKCKRISRWMIAGLITGFAGILLIFSDHIGEMKNPNFLLGIGLSILSVLSWSYGTVYSSQHRTPISILFSVGLQMFIAGIIMLLVCAVTGKYINLAEAGRESWLALLYLVVFGSLIAYSAFVFAISKLPPTLVSVYAYINPVVAVGLGWLLLSEKLNAIMVTGMLITLAGVYMVNREFRNIKR